jgi:hypothetical protein
MRASSAVFDRQALMTSKDAEQVAASSILIMIRSVWPCAVGHLSDAYADNAMPTAKIKKMGHMSMAGLRVPALALRHKSRVTCQLLQLDVKVF